MGVVLSFIKNFVIKYLTAGVLEKLAILLLGELVKRTDSKVDDEIYCTVFHKCEEGEKCRKCSQE